jgi:pimeloyl-ACP methyl ester carboxylesterase
MWMFMARLYRYQHRCAIRQGMRTGKNRRRAAIIVAGMRTLAALGVLLSACFRAPVPMEKIDYPASAPPARCLVVMMPGAGSNDGDFEKEGFLKVVQDSGLSIDVIAANATLGYYFNNTMVPRLHDDIVVPATTGKQYEKKWIMGMSMGGFGTLFYSLQHPHDFDGMYALAPWLGSNSLIEEIRNAGGLKKWQAPAPETPTNDNYQRQLWRFLQAVSNDPSQGPDVYVGWGDQDSLGPADQLFADALPQDHVGHQPGAHQWPVWNALLAKWLKDGPLARDCAKGPAAAPVSSAAARRTGPWWMQRNSFKLVVLGRSLRPHVDAPSP